MRDVVLGNGSMMLNFDRELNLRDFYWPYGGFENHGDRNRTSFGVFVDGRMVWVFEPEWIRSFGVVGNTPITRISAEHPELKIRLEIQDALHPAEDVYVKRIRVWNLKPEAREIRVLFYQDFSIRGIEAGDSAVFDPQTGGIYQYKKGIYILANCRPAGGGTIEYSAGVKRYHGKEGTFRDAEDGRLSLNPIADGPVDSALSALLQLPGNASEVIDYWLISGYSLSDVRTLQRNLLERPIEEWLHNVGLHYRSWIKRAERNFQDLSPAVASLYEISLFTIRSQIERKGAVVASPDGDTFQFARDHYMYLWPRDAALIARSLDQAGYPEEARRIYKFCATVIEPEGFFLQRYNPDGSVGATWHPRLLHGMEVPPIQEDETALVIWALGEHIRQYGDYDVLAELYEPLVKPALLFLAGYIDPLTGLPGLSWDLWEERRGIFSFTAASVYGALAVGNHMAESMNDGHLAGICENAARRVKQAIAEQLYHTGVGRFVRGLYVESDGTYHPDFTLDASQYGLVGFGVFEPSDERIEATMEAIAAHLWVKTPIGGVARYTGDYYHRRSEDLENVPGNPWIITTLWVAEWLIQRDKTGDLERARRLIEWASAQAGPAGLLPEQMHPYTGAPLSVCPLTWSHAGLVTAVSMYLDRKAPVETGAE
ncbi:MAG: glycoside hydrolase family 15 protein [Solirubrobacterales bacterium]